MEEIACQADLPAEGYFGQSVYAGLSFRARMRTAPIIHRAFCQDGFDSQDDRLPKDKDGHALPSMSFVDGRRVYRIPAFGQPMPKKEAR
jgi:hypothetical protein